MSASEVTILSKSSSRAADAVTGPRSRIPRLGSPLSPCLPPLFLFLLLIPGLLLGCGDESRPSPGQEAPTTPRHVETTVAKPVSLTIFQEIPATVVSRQEARISPKIMGSIKEVHVRLGAVVQKGQLLARLSAGELDARVEQAKARLHNIIRNLKREEGLLSQDASTPETVNELRDQANVARAALEEAKSMVSYTLIRAPFPGVITMKQADLGDMVSPGQVLFVLKTHRAPQILAFLPEKLAASRKIGEPLEVAVASTGQAFTATISEINKAADPASRTVEVKMDTPGSQALIPGQFVRVKIPRRQGRTIFLPPRAVSRYGQLVRVFVVREKRAWLRIVRTGPRTSEGVEIISGLDPGDEVILDPSMDLKDGQPVKVVGRTP